MTEQQNPITPPDELVRKWLENYFGCWDNVTTAAADVSRYIAAKSTQWGYEQRGADIEAKLQKARDEELEACCEVLARELICDGKHVATDLRAIRRPNPPSLKKQAKFAAAVLRSPDETCSIAELQQHWHTICNALEQLND